MINPIALFFAWIWLGSVVLAPMVADGKGHSLGGWIVTAICFGPLALVAAAGLPDRRPQGGE